MALRRGTREQRTNEQLREQYEIERELADRLRNASRIERGLLYASLYDELFRRVPHHPLVARKSSAEDTARSVASKMRFLEKFLDRDTTFLEIGPGDCVLSLAVSRKVKQVIAVEVSRELAANLVLPQNVQLIFSDGSSVPVPRDSVDVAYSHQVMEHLHPEDAVDQARGVFQALRHGGAYICITPNRLSGPHDISKYFDAVARGFHLKEYTCTELAGILKSIGFSSVRVHVRVGRRFVHVPLPFVRLVESAVGGLSRSPVRRFARSRLVSGFLGIRVVAWK
jgi:SAM-dependent methyltransferase